MATILVGAAVLVALLALAAVGLLAGARRRTRRELALLRDTADRLRDDVWRLEAAAADRDRAEAANEAKGRFLATVSHEIRTPLAGIIGTADLLASMPLGGEAASYVTAIRTSGTALSSLIDEILDFSRIDAGRLELADVPFALRPLIEGIIELLSPRAQNKGLALASLVDANVPLLLRGDPARLRQILLNLAGNAIKFTLKGGVGLRVSGEADGAVRFAMSDTGPGIAPDRQSAIFEEFERGDASPGHGGTGLGLAISRALATRMGGSLALDPSAGPGATFVLTLPSTHSEPSRAPPPLTDARVLLVARAPFEAPFLARRLEALGAAVTRVGSEEDAAAAMSGTTARGPFNHCVIDCALGEPAALRLAAAAAEAGVSRTTVLLSPYERRALSPAGWRAFGRWLVKPVREASLRACLEPTPSRCAGERPAEPPSLRLDGRRVLLAEDDDVNALVATRMLERQGATVTRVRDGASALSALCGGHAPFDAAVLDIRMPARDGLSVARAVRDGEATAGVRRLPLVALSANAFADDRQAALAAGFDAFLVKPAPIEALAANIAQLTGNLDVRSAA